MHEQMAFCWAQYAPYHIIYFIEEMNWPCFICNKPVRLYDAVMDVDHGNIACSEACREVSRQKTREWLKTEPLEVQELYEKLGMV